MLFLFYFLGVFSAIFVIKKCKLQNEALTEKYDDISSGTIGHVAHGKSTVVKAISGVQVKIHSMLLNFKVGPFKGLYMECTE